MNITPEQALQALDAATAPANAGKLTRIDYGNAEAALNCLGELAREHRTAQALITRLSHEKEELAKKLATLDKTAPDVPVPPTSRMAKSPEPARPAVRSNGATKP